MHNKLKIGLIIDGTSVNFYKKNLIEFIINEKLYFSSPIIISQNLNFNEPKTSFFNINFFSIIIKKIINKFINYIELKKVKKNKLHKYYGDTFSISNYNLVKLEVSPNVSKSGYIYRYSSKDLENIKELKLDILIRCGTGILKGDILNITKFGIISFHHGDNRFNRGGPSGFWETYLNWPSTGFVIQKLSEELDGGSILYRGNIKTSALWHENNAQLLLKSNFFLLKILKYISINNSLPLEENSIPFYNNTFKQPNIFILLKYILKEYSFALKYKIFSKFNFKEMWSVSFLKSSDLNINMKKAITIINPHNRFLADPFVIKHKNRNICFVEDYYYNEKKGKISAYELFENSYVELGIALEEDFHLSFPFVFKDGDNIYMIPETSKNKDIRLYKCTDFPLQWEFEKTLINNVDAVDTLVFENNSKWYMLTNVCSSSIGDHNSELYIYESDKLISDKWIPFDSNPLIFDTLRSRNAGLFKLNGNYYRVNQVQSKHYYGRSFKINKVISINDNYYKEEEVCHVKPYFFEKLIGTHHFHMNEEYCVFDHCSLSK